MLFIVFTGEDAVLQPTERFAMEQFNGMVVKHIFAACKEGRQGGAGGTADSYAAALSVNAADVQKMVIVEQHAKRA